MEYITVESHFPHIDRKVADAHIRHTLPDFCLFILGQPDTICMLLLREDKNIQCLKETESNRKQYEPINGKQLSLFQILLSNIVYNVFIEIMYLVGLIAISLMQNLLPIVSLKYITAICIFIILHILFVLLESVAQMYLTFWANKK